MLEPRAIGSMVLLVGVVLAGSVLAEEEASAPPLAAPTLHGRLELSLADAITMGIENNLQVEVDRHDPLIAFEDSEIAWGAYDPELFSDFRYASTETPIASSLQASTRLVERQASGNAGLRGVLPAVGASYELKYTGNRLQTTSSIQSLSPEYRTTILASVTIPLLKGLWWNAPWTKVKTTGIGYEQSLEEFRRRLMDLVQEIETGYWNVIATQEQLRVAEKSLEANRALLERSRAQYEVGVVSKVEVVEGEAGVAEREFDRITQENTYLAAQDALIDLVLGPNLTPTSRLEIDPTDRPEDYVDYEVDVDEATHKALENRPELQLARNAIEQRRIELQFAKNQRLPQLDVLGTFGFQGLAGRTNPAPGLFPPGPRAPITSVRRSYSTADDDFFSADGAKQWSGMAVLSIPLGNIEGRHGLTKAQIELRKSRTQLRKLEQDIVLEIRKAARDLQTGLKGIKASEERGTAAREQFRAENIRLEHGESTPFDVLQREEDLVEAESQHIGALRFYRNSITALARFQGTILKDRNILVDEARTLR